ncbi:MAG: hypothetical protein ACLPVI_02055 [Dehalococcoidales bacterium]
MDIGIIPLISAIISFVFALTVLDQYFARRQPFQLLWTIGLFMYGISAFTEFYTETYGLHLIMFRIWFLFGAICVAAFLGQGTVYLLLRRRTAHFLMVIVAIISIYSAVRLFTVSIDLGTAIRLTDKINVPADVGILTGVMNVYGTVTLVGGALYSAWIFWRKRILPHRVQSNVLIALGALLPAIGGSLLKLGTAHGATFYILELAGVIIIFIGFLRTKEVFGFFRFPLIHGFARVKEANLVQRETASQKPDKTTK